MIAPDLDLVHRYEAQLDPARPTAGDMDVTIIGYGEISAVLQFAACDGYVFKRMAGFLREEEVADFTRVIGEYCAALAERGVNVIPTMCHPVDTPRNGRVVYLVQPALLPETIGNAILKSGDETALRELLRAVLTALGGVYAANREPGQLSLGVDAQISNWSWTCGGPADQRPVYIDVGAPFMRRNGAEVMDWDVLVRALPPPLRWYMRKFELQGVLDRYHRLHVTLVDIAGNFIKEGCADRVDLALEEFAAWLDGPGVHLDVRPPTREAVEKYYAADANIWTYVLAARKLHRFARTRLLRQPYSHILPGTISRR